MDSKKRIPQGAVRTLGVMTLKKAGDFVEVWPILEESLKGSYK